MLELHHGRAVRSQRPAVAATHAGLVIDGEVVIAADQNVKRQCGHGPSSGPVSILYEVLRQRTRRPCANSSPASTSSHSTLLLARHTLYHEVSECGEFVIGYLLLE